MPKKAILWDNDGVLVDTEHLYYRSTREIFEEVGYKLSKDIYVEKSLRAGRSLFDILHDEGFPAKEVTELKARRDDLYGSYVAREDVVIPGMEEVLKNLHGRVGMGVVTSSKRGHFNIIHKKTGFSKYFDFVIVREDCVESKPSPEPYLKGVAASGIPAPHCIAIEDSERGLRSAVAAGVDCIVTPRNLSAKMNFPSARKVCQNPGELLEYLTGIIA